MTIKYALFNMMLPLWQLSFASLAHTEISDTMYTYQMLTRFMSTQETIHNRRVAPPRSRSLAGGSNRLSPYSRGGRVQGRGFQVRNFGNFGRPQFGYNNNNRYSYWTPQHGNNNNRFNNRQPYASPVLLGQFVRSPPQYSPMYFQGGRNLRAYNNNNNNNMN